MTAPRPPAAWQVGFQPERFPEPAFSALQRRVFADLQGESAALAQLLTEEGPALPDGGQAPMLRFAARRDGELLGWSVGWMERGRVYYMAHSGVVPEARRQGLYAALLDAVVAHVQGLGAVSLRSQHSVLNNAILRCKLGQGFHVSGFSHSPQMGALVELTRHLHPGRQQLWRERVLPLVPPPP